jgi:hypothetical protein
MVFLNGIPGINRFTAETGVLPVAPYCSATKDMVHGLLKKLSCFSANPCCVLRVPGSNKVLPFRT